jgi:membrane protein YqaA with SNARE-associated domain
MRAYLLQYAQRFLRDRKFPYLVALVGFADMFVFVVPNDLLLVAEATTSPHRRRSSVAIVSLGSALGAVALAFALKEGISTLLYFNPQTAIPGWWASATSHFERNGSWELFLSALSPIPVQPFVAGAIISHFTLLHIFGAVLAGRIVKYSALAYLTALLPNRFKSLSG